MVRTPGPGLALAGPGPRPAQDAKSVHGGQYGHFLLSKQNGLHHTLTFWSSWGLTSRAVVFRGVFVSRKSGFVRAKSRGSYSFRSNLIVFDKCLFLWSNPGIKPQRIPFSACVIVFRSTSPSLSNCQCCFIADNPSFW